MPRRDGRPMPGRDWCDEPVITDPAVRPLTIALAGIVLALAG